MNFFLSFHPPPLITILTLSQLPFYSYTFPFSTNLFIFFFLYCLIAFCSHPSPISTLRDFFLKLILGEGVGKFTCFQLLTSKQIHKISLTIIDPLTFKSCSVHLPTRISICVSLDWYFCGSGTVEFTRFSRPSLPDFDPVTWKQYLLAWWMFLSCSVEIPSLNTELSHHMKWMLTDEQRMDGSPSAGKCILPCCDLNLWPLTLKTFSTISNMLPVSTTITGAALPENNEAYAELTTANGGTFTSCSARLRSQSRYRSLHALMWLATETGWARSKRSAICSGKLISGYMIWYEVRYLEYICIGLSVQ